MNRNDIVPLKMPCTTRTSSPLARSVRRVETMGKPAPMVPSYSHFAFPCFAAVLMDSKRTESPELAFLLGVTTCTPRFSHPAYRLATFSEEVLSTITAAPPERAAAASSASTKAPRSTADTVPPIAFASQSSTRSAIAPSTFA